MPGVHRRSGIDDISCCWYFVAHADQGADQTETFGDIVVRYSAISTDQLFPEVAKSYGIERSSRWPGQYRGAEKRCRRQAATVAATVSGSVADLTGHRQPIAFRETSENGDIDYLGEFPIERQARMCSRSR